jgi:BMFP domain-containing protein YqiC
VKDSVPIEFELRRARDMLGEIIPEMQANVRLIAQEEVEVANLKAELARGEESLEKEQNRIVKLRNMLTAQKASYEIGGYDYSHQQVKQELANRFDRFKEAEMVHQGKERLLETRQESLKAAMQMLDRTRAEKTRLENQIESLESQYRLVQAAAAGSTIDIDRSKLAKTEKLIQDIRKRLDVAERVLAHESRFTQPIEVDVINEADLLEQVDDHFNPDANEPIADADVDSAESVEPVDQSVTMNLP